MISLLRERKKVATDRLGAETAKSPDLATTTAAKAINEKRDLVQEQLNKPLCQDACEKAETLLDEIEQLVVEVGKQAEEKKRGIEVATEMQATSREALRALNKVAPPAGYEKLDGKDLGDRLRGAAGYASVKAFETVISALVSGKSEPEPAKIKELISKAGEIKKAIKEAGDEVLVELQDRAGQVQNQRDLVDEQIRKAGEMLEKLQNPSLLVANLLKSWPRGVTRPRDLNQQLLALVDTDDLEKKLEAVHNLGETELKTSPWTDADWLGNVMPSATGLSGDLRKALKDMNVAAQSVVVDALDKAMVDARKTESDSKDAVRNAIQGKEQRKQLAADLTEPGKTVYAEIEKALEKNSKLNIVKQLELVDSIFLTREESLKDLQQKLVEEAKTAGVQTAELDPTRYNGKQYALLGTHGKATVYARLDDCPTSAGMGAHIGLYNTALTKGIIPASSTGSEGVKFESHLNGWVVKVTMRAVAHNPGFDNTWSPLASINTAVAQIDDPPTIYLNFDDWTQRH